MDDFEIGAHEARVNVTYQGTNGELPDPVPFAASDAEIRRWATEAVRAGGVSGLDAQDADFGDYIIERFDAGQNRNYNLVMIRPKTAFGG